MSTTQVQTLLEAGNLQFDIYRLRELRPGRRAKERTFNLCGAPPSFECSSQTPRRRRTGEESQFPIEPNEPFFSSVIRRVP